jgi:ABC-type multidrug transport system fused ATPase/permease subunit
MLSIIKHIKTNAQEKHFYGSINGIREAELKAYKSKGTLESIMNFLYYLTAPCILSALFIAMLITIQEITAAKVFVMMTIAHIFEFTAYGLPRSISELISIINSLKRIEEFLMAEEIDQTNYAVEA